MSRNKAELEQMAQEQGWQEPKNLREFYAMSPDAATWLETCKPEVLERIASENPGKTSYAPTPKDVFESRGYKFPTSREEYYAGDADYQALCQTVFPDELNRLLNPPQEVKEKFLVRDGETREQAARKHGSNIGHKFIRLHTQYVVSPENAEAIRNRCTALGITDATSDYDLLVEVFQDAARAGELSLDITKIGLPQATLDYVQNQFFNYKLPSLILTGRQLQAVINRIPLAEKLLDEYVPLTEEQLDQRRIAAMSSEEFDRTDPVLVAARKAENVALMESETEREFKRFASYEPSFHDTRENRRKITSWLKKNELRISHENMKTAFDALFAEHQIGQIAGVHTASGVTQMTVHPDASEWRDNSFEANAFRRRVNDMTSAEFDKAMGTEEDFAQKVEEWM